ncbi:MAG TPA: NDP-sugar synthase [Mycobacteriales bacterium]|jgi:mannose-1-phosphate guanylyltransferase|nr:NDP-sugar synthase [Mycobacteriales bacterium]
MDAVLLVGGQGTRLRPLTCTTPKPMLPTAGVPFLEHLLVRARDAGVDHAVLSTSYRPEVFEGHFGSGEALGLRITYVTEAEPLGTGGAIRNVAEHLRGDDFLVFNGDVLSGVDLRALVAAHRSRHADATLYLTEVADARAFGCVPTDDGGRVTAFLEKMPQPVTNRINAGCYVFAPSVLDAIPAGRPVSVERETFPALLSSGALVYGHVDRSYWLDLGTPAAFVTGCRDLVRGVVPSAALPGPAGESLVLDGAVVEGEATGGSTVGRGARVGVDAYVDGSVLFDGAVVERGARVTRSVVGRGAHVGAGTVLDGVVVGDEARIGARNELVDGARVWPGAVLADGAVRFSPDA